MYWFESQTGVKDMEDYELDYAYDEICKILKQVLDTKHQLEERLNARH